MLIRDSTRISGVPLNLGSLERDIPKLIKKKKEILKSWGNMLGGRNPADRLRLVLYSIIYKVLYIPGG